MKKFLSLFLVIVLLLLALSSCSLGTKNSDGDDTDSDNPNDIVPGLNELPGIPVKPSSGETKTKNLQFTYVYDHSKLADTGEKIAALLVEGGYLMGGFESVIIPKDVVAGDVITIKYTGEILTDTSHPGMTFITGGNLKTYSIKYSEVIHLTGEEIDAQRINSEYDLSSTNVIIDKVGRFVPLEEFEGEDLYLVLNQEKAASLSEGDDQPTPIACMLAYNPRG